MAIVEKRKNPWLALFLNHLMIMFIAIFMVFSLTGIARTILGSILSLFYYKGIYDYAHKAGKDHSQPFDKTNPSYKFPLFYGIIGNIYFWVPVLILLILGNFITSDTGAIIIRLIYLIFDSPFIFLNVFSSTDYNSLNIWQPILFSSLFFVSSFLGYFLGQKGRSLKGVIKNLKKNKVER